jgi:hypothetical protein
MKITLAGIALWVLMLTLWCCSRRCVKHRLQQDMAVVHAEPLPTYVPDMTLLAAAHVPQ